MFKLSLIFKEIFLPFLKIFNEEVSSNNKDEVSKMISAVPKLSYAVSHYASHRLRSDVQFSAIEKIMQSMKTDPSIIYMVTDQFILADEILRGTG